MRTMPKRIAGHARFVRDEIHSRDDSRIERGVGRDAGVEDRDRHARPGVGRRAAEAEEPSRHALPERDSAGDLVGDGVVVRGGQVCHDGQVARDIREERVPLEGRELFVGDLDRHRSAQLATQEAVQPAANRAERARIDRLDDDAVPVDAARMRRQVVGNGRQLGLSRWGRDPGAKTNRKSDGKRNESFHEYCSVLNQPTKT
jgi:hypothetical protein